MPKPTMDEDLFTSPDPHPSVKGPDDEVQELVDGLISSTYLNPVVKSFLQEADHADLFLPPLPVKRT